MDEAHRLALEISSCSQVSEALKSQIHPCNSVVNWQASQWDKKLLTIENSKMHRPEAWTGDITKAKIVFVSSNPSFNKAENFPSWESEVWPESEIASFGADRFSYDKTREYGATESNIIADKDRTIGFNGVLSERVPHWQWVRNFASLILKKNIVETSAINDYVMTELVHCKSPHEEGVVKALEKCRTMWFTKIMTLSPAKLIFVTGVKSGTDFANLYSDSIPDDWGSWSDSSSNKGKGNWPLTEIHLNELIKRGEWTFECQKKNSVEIEISGIKRTVVYIARPGGGGGLCTPWNHSDLIDPKLIDFWREQAGLIEN
jgi:hypothetical protein